MRQLSSAALEAAFSQQTSEVWLTLLTLSHPDLAAPIRVVNNTQNITSGGEIYQAFPFVVELPSERDGEVSGARLSICNVDRTIILAVRSIIGKGPATAEVSIVLASSPDVVEAGPLEFEARAISYTADVVSAELVYETRQYAAVPPWTFNPNDFGGLF